MVEITVKALDSASAMEEVEKRLGADALIVSTNKVDGHIEIVATNDEPSDYKERKKTLVLDSSFQVEGFPNILKNKMPNPQEKVSNSEVDEISTKINESAEKIKAELNYLLKISATSQNRYSIIERPFSEFKSAGFKASIFKKIGLTAETDTRLIAKSISRAFVNGKCDHFEKTKLYIVSGPSLSGKTLFSKKLKSLLEQKDEIEGCEIYQRDLSNSFTGLKKWVGAARINDEKRNKVGIVELANSENFENIALEFKRHFPELRVSIINIMPVGNSYEFLMRNFPPRTLENEYLALTKLDICDLSMQEINAFIDLDQKCMFFSGTTSIKDGLFFAQMEKTISHILQNIEVGAD